MNVLFVASGNSSRGIGAIVQNQGESLKANGINIEYFVIKGKGFKGYLTNTFILRKYLKSNPCDIIHAHYSLSGIAAACAGAKPLIVSLMGSDIQVKFPRRAILKFFNRFSWDRVIVKSRDMKELMEIERAHILPNGVDLTTFKIIDKKSARKKVGFKPGKKHIIFIANPERYEKNFGLAQKAYHLLEREDVELHAVYDIDHEQIPYFMNAADVLLLTSLWEGSPNVVKEAMACNLPIVATHVGDVREVIGKTGGCYITTFAPADAAAKLRMALSFGKRTNGREHIKHLDSHIIARQIIKLYNDVNKT